MLSFCLIIFKKLREVDVEKKNQFSFQRKWNKRSKKKLNGIYIGHIQFQSSEFDKIKRNTQLQMKGSNRFHQ